MLPRPRMGQATMLVGKPTKGYKTSTMIVLSRKHRSKWWSLVCFGQRGHYRPDGSCEHTDEVLASLNPEKVCRERVRICPFGEEQRA